MPTTIQELFEKFNLTNYNKVALGTKFAEKEEGIYIVSTSADIQYKPETLSRPLFDDNIIQKWIEKLPVFTIDLRKPTLESLKQRLSEFWLADETILYIGKAPTRSNGEGISNRVDEYYRTKIGDRSPNSGGQWIKTLKNLSSTFIHFARVEEPDKIEKAMLKHFMDNVSQRTLQYLRDKELPLPFANLCYTPRIEKKHGLSKQREPR